jgi:hypothetical protein
MGCIIVFELYEEMTIDELKIKEATELITDLMPSLEEQDNGN